MITELTSVEAVLVKLRESHPDLPHELLKAAAQAALSEVRQGRPADPTVTIDSLTKPSLQPVVNATGVILHTNLGRAPLGPWTPIAGYSHLEYDLTTGRRGRRDHHLDRFFGYLLNARGLAVNNNAAATYLVLHELAHGAEVIVSRGELIEIGDGFRIPDIMRRAGCTLVEVGTTNRTRLDDYRAAITDRTALILRVHPSNFHITGFTGKPALRELCSLPVPVYEDLGSGCLVDLKAYGIDEPLVRDSLDAGVSVVTFSGDKLLGGPQAGLIAGDGATIERIRRNPMFRALRIDKLVTQALENALRAIVTERWDELPAIAMIRQTPERIRDRAERLRAQLELAATVIPGESLVGGGSTPDQSLPTWLLAIPRPEMERRLRMGKPPVIARVEKGQLLIDLRTVFPHEEAALLGALHVAAFAG
ncbi:MAG: L-seryl-tRNA(Sec) selenium transferase [Acidobacteria bacterium]|jgi:L-seryl-tRNA(Ser) seleniumtransferase|nr:L-seryl-tRNA(Sec) selenium transferase [Bryobacteraceae bacterium CoA2 C42]